jgi:hypothetical protein
MLASHIFTKFESSSFVCGNVRRKHRLPPSRIDNRPCVVFGEKSFVMLEIFAARRLF